MEQILYWVPIIITAASAICAFTPTPKDDNLLAKIYKVIEVAAININKAKD